LLVCTAERPTLTTLNSTQHIFIAHTGINTVVDLKVMIRRKDKHKEEQKEEEEAKEMRGEGGCRCCRYFWSSCFCCSLLQLQPAAADDEDEE
jgi:hypothetical protein